MEYVADELGVAGRCSCPRCSASCRRAPTRAAIRQLRRCSASAGRTSCTRTRRRPGRPAGSPRCSPGSAPADGARPHLPRPRAQRLLLARAASGSSGRIERLLAHVDRRARRGERRGARRPRRASASRRAERFAVVPYGFELPDVERRGRGGARDELRAELGAGGRDVRDRLGRPADARSSGRSTSSATLRAVRGRGRRRRARARRRRRGARRDARRSRASSASPSAAASSATSAASATGTRRSTRSLLTSANEGTPVVAIEALAAGRPVVATRAGGTGTVVARRRERLPARRSATTPALAERLAELAARPGAARAARRGTAAPTSARASRASGWRTRSRRSTGGCSREGAAPPQGDGRQRLRAPPARAAARRCAPRGIDARFLGLDVAGTDAPRFYGELDALGVPYRRVRCGARRRARAWRATSSRAVRGGAARPPAHAPRARRRLRRRRRARDPHAVRLHAAQRRPLPARARSATSTAPSRAGRAG